MRIWLYCICRDEAVIMPYFLRHYSAWVDKLIFYDDQSTDGTREMIHACPKAELRDWPGTRGAIVDDEFLAFANEQWKEARGHADWVIWVDADEILYHKHMLPTLATYLNQGVEVPQITGYTMFSRQLPTTKGQIYEEIFRGILDPHWSKHAIFRGNIVWEVGRHAINLHLCQPKFSPTAEIKLLHYRCLGLDYLRERHARNWARVPEYCRRHNYGVNTSPGWAEHHGVKWFEEMSFQHLQDVV